MSGDITEVLVDPSLGLRGVEQALTASNPNFYPKGSVVVIHSVEGSTKITTEEKLWVFIKQEPMCQLVNITNEVIQGTNSSYRHAYKHFHLLLENDTPCHLYVRTDTARATFHLRSTPLTVTRGGGVIHPHDAMIIAMRRGFILSARDHYVIEEILVKFMPQIVYGARHRNIGELSFLCSCGHAVKQLRLNAHYKTKLKHTNGDEEGRNFMERARAYIDQMDMIYQTAYIGLDRPIQDDEVYIDLDQFAQLDQLVEMEL